MNGIERPTIFMGESATNNHVAATSPTVNVHLRSTPQQQPLQLEHHCANPFHGQNFSVTRNLKPEENDEASPKPTWTNPQGEQGDGVPVQCSAASSTHSQPCPEGDGVPVQRSAASSTHSQPCPQGDGVPVQRSAASSTHSQPCPQGDGVPVQRSAASSTIHQQLSPDSQGPVAASASWRHPQQEIGQPPLPIDTLVLPFWRQLQLQFNSESQGGLIPMNPLEPLELQCSARSLHSTEPRCSNITLLISDSLPDTSKSIQKGNIDGVLCPGLDVPCLWDASTLAAFGELRDFTSEEAMIAATVLGTCEAKLPLNICQFMVALQELKGAKEKLRVLAEKLKEARMDVVGAMHCQKSLLPNLGPRTPEKRFIKNMTHSQRLPFTTALSTEHPTGHDWKWLAEHLEIPSVYIKNWEQRERNPGELVLNYWQGKIAHATVGNLFDLMLKMDREDLADML